MANPPDIHCGIFFEKIDTSYSTPAPTLSNIECAAIKPDFSSLNKDRDPDDHRYSGFNHQKQPNPHCPKGAWGQAGFKMGVSRGQAGGGGDSGGMFAPRDPGRTGDRDSSQRTFPGQRV